jgi:hypothetical protein
VAEEEEEEKNAAARHHKMTCFGIKHYPYQRLTEKTRRIPRRAMPGVSRHSQDNNTTCPGQVAGISKALACFSFQ